MDIFLKSGALVLIVCVLYQMVSVRDKEIGVLLVVLGCAIVLYMAISYLEPVFAFVRKLQVLGNLNDQMLEILLKSAGIGLLAEICVLVCNDTGNSSMGKALQVLATVAIMWLSLPMFGSVLELIGEILGEL